MEEPADGNATRKSEKFARCKDDAPYYSTLDEPTSGRSTPARSQSVSACRPPSGRSTPAAARSVSGRSTPGYGSRSMTPEPPPVPPATYHWEEVRRQRSVGGYPWTHLNKPAFDEKTWVKYERDHVYEPVTPAASTDRISARPQPAAKDDGGGRHFLRIPLTEELVMADDTGSEPEDKRPRSEEQEEEEEDEEDEDEEEDDDDEEEEEDDDDEKKPSARSDESIYEGENENSSVGETADASRTPRMKMFQQKVKVKAGVLRTKLQGVTKRKPKQKIAVVEGPCNGGGGGGGGGGAGEKIRRKFGQFATLPKKFTFNAPKVNFSAAFGKSSSPSRNSADANESSADDTKSGGRFSLPRFGFAKTASESPKTGHKTAKIGASRLSVPGFRTRTWSDASKISKPASPKPNNNNRLMDFGTYPRIFSKRRKTAAANSKAQTPPPPPPQSAPSGAGDAEPSSKRKDSFRRRFFRSPGHKECTPAPTDERQTAAGCTLAVEEEELLDETHCASKESLAEFGDSDLQEVVSLSDDCSRSAKDTKSLSEHRPGVIEEIDSDEFFLREKGLSRGDVHISNYLSSEIRDVFRSSRIVRSVEIVNNRATGGRNNDDDNGTGDDAHGTGAGIIGCSTPVRPSRTNSLRRPARYQSDSTDAASSAAVTDRFSTMPKSFGGTGPPKRPEDDVPENIITSQTFEPSNGSSALPTAFRVPWRTAGHAQDRAVEHMPPKPPTRQRMSKFSTFDTRSMIDLSRKRSQSQIGFLPNFSDTVPKAPLRRSRASLAGSERDVSAMPDGRPSWSAGGSGAPTPPLRRSRMSLAADVEERSAVKPGGATPPARPPPPPSQLVTAGYATVDKTSLLVPPQSPVRHRRKKSYDMINKGQEFGAFFTIPRSYSYGRARSTARSDDETKGNDDGNKLPPPSRPARAYNTLGPSRPLRRRLPAREHEYGDVADGGGGGGPTTSGRDGKRESSMAAARSSSSVDGGDGPAKALCSGDVIEKMKLRPLPSPPAPPRNKTKAGAEDAAAEPHRRRNTDSALVPFLDRRETSATSSNGNDDFFADVSRALLASAAKNSVAAAESVGVQTDRLPGGTAANGYESDDGSRCSSSAGSDDRPTASCRPWSTAAAAAAADRPASRASSAAVDRPTSRTSTTTEYVDRPTSRAAENGHVVMLPAPPPPPPEATGGGGGVICAQRLSVNELRVGKMTVADVRGQYMGVDRAHIAHHLAAACSDAAAVPTLETAAAAVLPPHNRGHQLLHHYRHNRTPQDDAVSVQSSRVSSMYPEVDSDEDRTSLMGVPTPPRRRSKLATRSSSSKNDDDDDDDDDDDGKPAAAAVDPSITELSCQLFRLCHSNVCSVFNKVVQQVVPEDTEKRRDLQAALCFLSIILAGLLILGFGNEKTVHHHHWDFQFPPSNQ